MAKQTEPGRSGIPAPSRPRMPASYGVDRSATTGMVSWSHVDEQLAGARNYWLATAGSDGRPHAAPVWGVWHEGRLYFATDRRSRKGRNLAANPRLAVHLESGDDVVMLEGTAVEVNDAAAISAASDAYAAKYDGIRLPAESDGPNAVYTIQVQTAYAWLERDFPGTATRWVFDEGGSDRGP